MTGRTSKKTDARVAALCRLLEGGMTRRGACASVGIASPQLYRWLEADVAFRSAIEKAEARAEERYTAIIASAAADDARWAAWWLERRRSDEYARRERLDVDIRARAEQMAEQLGLDAQELIREAERLALGQWRQHAERG